MSNLCTKAVPFNPLKRTITHPNAIEWSTAQALYEDDLHLVASRLAPEDFQPDVEPGALTFIKDHIWDRQPENYPAWEMLEDLFDEIATRPGSAIAFKELLYNVEYLRGINGDRDSMLRGKQYQMVERIAKAVELELEIWDHSVSEKEHKFHRPADIYRRYGLALRYAVEELGSFRAKDVLNELMCENTLPIDELENPAWIDPYTGDGDKQYEFVRVKSPDPEVSSDGNVPVLLADLLDGLGEQADNFKNNLKNLGLTLNDYWRQFLEAQRSGYSPLPEPEDEREEVEFDVIEKDFEFKADLRVEQDAVDKLEKVMAREFRMIKELIGQTANEVAAFRELQAKFEDLDGKKLKSAADRVEFAPQLQAHVRRMEWMIEAILKRAEELPRSALDVKLRNKLAYLPFRWPLKPQGHNIEKSKDLMRKKIDMMGKVTWDLARARFFSNSAVKDLVRSFSRFACSGEYDPKDLMTVLLPFQNAYGFQEEDLAIIAVPQGWGWTLAGWYEIHGDEYLEQFLTKGEGGINPSSDPRPDELEMWTDNLTQDRIRTYKSRKGASAWRKVYRETTGSTAVKKEAADAAFEEIYQVERAKDIERIKARGLKPNARNNPEFIEAEVMAAIMGDGGSEGPIQAGWDAWRGGIDHDANACFKREYSTLKNQGLAHREATKKAMEVFWREVKRNRDRITGISSAGIRLANGRQVDWGITLLKLKANEIPMTIADFDRLLNHLIVKKWGTPPLRAYLQQRISEEMKKLQPAQ